MVSVNSAVEEWRPVSGFEDLYEVSDKGRVRGVERTARIRGGALRKISSSLKSPVPTAQKGYHAVHLYCENKRTVRYIHTLVLESFVGPRPVGLEACHGPLGHLVNTPDNLRWDTKSGNMQDTIRDGNHNNASRTHCRRNHSLADAYINPTSGGRHCRVCQRLRAKGLLAITVA